MHSASRCKLLSEVLLHVKAVHNFCDMSMSYRVVFLTDIHAESDQEALRDVEQLLAQVRPHLLQLGGDIGKLTHLEAIIELYRKYAIIDPSLPPPGVLIVLGNNDEFDESQVEQLSRQDIAVKLLDRGLVILFPAVTQQSMFACPGMIIGGISRNIGFRPGPRRKTIDAYLRAAMNLAAAFSITYRALRETGARAIKVLLIHEVPSEVAEEAVRRGIIQCFNKKIADAVSEAIKNIRPHLVLHGHLHVDLIWTRVLDVDVVCTTWTRYRTFVLLELTERDVRVRACRFAGDNIEILMEKIVVS